MAPGIRKRRRESLRRKAISARTNQIGSAAPELRQPSAAATPAAQLRPRCAQAIASTQKNTAGIQLIPLVPCNHSSAAWELNSTLPTSAIFR